MLNSNPRLWATLALSIGLLPGSAHAQTVSNSFEEVRQVLTKGQAIVVTDTRGQRITGRVADVSPFLLVLLIPEPRTFTEATVTEIRTIDRLWNGAFIGAAIGTGFAMWDYLIDPSEPGNAAVFAMGIGLGAAIGAGVDALVGGGKILYAPARQTRRVMVSPVVGKDRQSVLVSVRF